MAVCDGVTPCNNIKELKEAKRPRRMHFKTTKLRNNIKELKGNNGSQAKRRAKIQCVIT